MRTTKLTIFATALIGSCLMANTAQASVNESYRCDLGGQFAFLTTIPEEGRAQYESLDGTFYLDAVGNGTYANDSEEISFEQDRPTLWLGDVSFACQGLVADNEQGGQNHASGAVGGNEVTLNVAGRSLGGKLRDGPGTNFSQTGSIAEGTWLTILTNTGIRFNGYDWFEITTDSGQRGYQWGGIMCSNGQQIAGIYQACQTGVAATATPSPNHSGGWMAFAVGVDGKFGHGAGTTRQAAEQYALQYCGEAGCQVADVTEAQCHALATVPGGFWFGAGQNEAAAQNFAMGFCTNATGAGCKIEYSFCR